MQQIGRYEILQEIGRGAMGVVFKGHDPLIGRAVAVKTITAGVAESTDLLERFYREARAAGGLQHPNIVTIYEMAESAGAPFIAMEYLEGESLEKLIARKPALLLATKLGYMVQTCRALEFAHRRGVVHRDVKPANIMVTPDGIVKVVDFGIARIADTSKTQTGALLGTLGYMSPEQLRGQQGDASCDIWALGIVLYELLAYQRPFTGDNHAAVLLSILQDEPRLMRQLLPECPAALEKIVSRALLKDEKQRYPTMDAFLKDLESVSATLGPEVSRLAATEGIPPASATPTLAPTQRIDVRTLPGVTVPAGANDAGKTHASKSNLPAATTIAQQPNAATAGARPAGLKPSTNPGVPLSAQLPRDPNRPTVQPKLSSWRKAASICAVLAVVLLVAFAAARHRKIAAANPSQEVKLKGIAPAPPLTATPGTAPAVTAPLTPTSVSLPTVESSASSLEDQQRQLIDLAHQAADKHDYKNALNQLDEAEKLNGPLNSLVTDLRHQFSEQAYGAELKRAASQEQALWDQGMAELQNGRLDDSERSLRELLTLPAGDRHWVDAERYVDEVIPQRRQELQHWSEAQVEASSVERGHLLKEVKVLDEVLAEGGPHQQQARQMRNNVIRQIVRDNARKSGVVEPTLSEGYESQLAQLESQFGALAVKGDVTALEGLQELRPKFKALAEAGGPLAMDARDYLNNVIPRTQKQIEDNLAAVASESSANAAYEGAVKEYDRAVAAQNTAMLRGRVLAAFQQIAQSGGIRAKEAERYIHVLIPAALKKSGQ
jgi:serine/threonine protein kinase